MSVGHFLSTQMGGAAVHCCVCVPAANFTSCQFTHNRANAVVLIASTVLRLHDSLFYNNSAVFGKAFLANDLTGGERGGGALFITDKAVGEHCWKASVLTARHGMAWHGPLLWLPCC